MKTKKIALGVYICCSLLAILATILGNDTLKLLTVPAVIPAIFFYYLSAKRSQPLNIYIVMILLLSFTGDTIVLLDIRQTEIIMIPYFLSYLVWLRFAILDVRKMKFEWNGLLLAVFIFSFLMYIMYALIELFMDTNRELIIPVIVYGSVLGTLASIAGYIYYTKNSTAAFYLAIAVLMSIVSDVFYIVFSLIVHFPAFNYFEFSVQLFSYFFIVRYCLLRKD